jgi:hypothetical protein
MNGYTPTATGRVGRDFRTEVRVRLSRIDRPGWRRFFLALVALSVSFFLALYSTALRDAGHIEQAAWVALAALILSGVVAFRVVPYLARRTVLERWMIKIEYEFTREGALYLVIIIIIAVAALNTGNNLLFIILSSLLAGILVSGVISKIVLSGLELEFVLPDHIFAEHPMVSSLVLHNLKWVFPSFSVTLKGRDAGQDQRKGKAESEPARRILDEPVYIPYIPHRSSVTQHVELVFPRRGRYTQEGFRVSTQFPFGFLRKAHEIETRQEILVLPNVQPTEEFYEILPLISGELESLSKGRGHDLYAIRDYQESDSARHVDWKASAKTQQLKVREFTREDERRVILAFDSSLPGSDEKTLAKFEKAVTFCACLAWHFHEIDAQMQFVSEEFETPMTSASEIIYPILEYLALVKPQVSAAAGGSSLLARLASAPRAFSIILTSQQRGSIPTNLWGSSYLVFMDAL